MHLHTRALAAAAAGALLSPLVASGVALAAGEATPPPVRSTAAFCAAAEAAFTDTAGTFADQIACIADAGITLGGPAGLPRDSYGPELRVRRDAMASFLARLADTADALDTGGAVQALPEPGDGAFSDVPAGGVHTRNILRLAQAGIVVGGPAGLRDDEYGPTLPLTRAQMASFVTRTLDYLTGETTTTSDDYFVDDEDIAVHEPSINALAALGIAVGDGQDRFAPSALISRAQMAGFLARALGLLQADDRISALNAPQTLQLLGIADFHGHLDPDRDGGPSVAGRLAGVVDQLRGEVPSTLFAASGDSVGGSPFLSAVAQDQPSLDALNAMGLDVSAVGNHEFDKGFDDLAGRIVPAADFPYLGANVEGESPDLPSSAVLTTAGGVDVGFIGVVTAQTGSLVAPSGIEGITFTDPVAAANREAARLSDGDLSNGEADVLVLLTHEGSETAASDAASCAALAAADDAFGEIVREADSAIDVVLGGHTHVRVDCQVANPGGRGERAVLQAGEFGEALAQLTFTLDQVDDTITELDGTVIDLEETFPDVTDPAVEAIVKAAQEQADELGAPVIGAIANDITRAFAPDGSEDRGSESDLGNFIADVQLDAVNQPGRPGAQIAFMNPGGIRGDLLVDDIYRDEAPGEVTFGEVGGIQPFGNTLVTMDLTGAQIDQVLEEQYQPAGASRPFLALGVSEGLFFVQDGDAPAGERISGITLDGEPLDPAAVYGVVVNSFLASGGDNFSTLTEGANVTDTGLVDLDAFVQFFERETAPVTADTESRRQIV